jgi:hypothetical protein
MRATKASHCYMDDCIAQIDGCPRPSPRLLPFFKSATVKTAETTTANRETAVGIGQKKKNAFPLNNGRVQPMTRRKPFKTILEMKQHGAAKMKRRREQQVRSVLIGGVNSFSLKS